MSNLRGLKELLEDSQDPNNPGPEEIKGVMDSVRTIAVVGISRSPDKAARRVPSYLAAKGYEIIPVNPFVDEILGKKARKSLAEVPEPVDMVLVFRPSQEAAEVARGALTRAEKPVIWLQQGIRADEVAEKAREEGVVMVQDLCAYEVHRALSSF